MKKYTIYLSSSITIEANSTEDAQNTALNLISSIASEPNIPSSDTEEILTGLHVDDLTEEYLDDQQLPESIADDGSIACMYDHDHSRGGCEWHD